jgi:molybdopterin-guanine dinucleotide biosynthesis protein A
MVEKFVALVLAGGQSRRMGEDKALLSCGGVTLLHRVCAIAQACTDQVYVVTSRSEHYREVVPRGCRFIHEPSPQGPLGAFAAGLRQVQTEWVLLLACDLPFLTAEPLLAWQKKLKTVPSDAIAALPYGEKGWEPLCGFYRQGCLPVLEAFIQQGGRSFQAWLAQQPVHRLSLDQAQWLFNCNTPADWQQVSNQRLPTGDNALG